mmetsp:Transcript_44760/g.129460  ORF Transcript_44760/g.129460 Transcript_44760/m.129460 type:complete len:240 (-) Transcript_44760:175-894(-)
MCRMPLAGQGALPVVHRHRSAFSARPQRRRGWDPADLGLGSAGGRTHDEELCRPCLLPRRRLGHAVRCHGTPPGLPAGLGPCPRQDRAGAAEPYGLHRVRRRGLGLHASAHREPGPDALPLGLQASGAPPGAARPQGRSHLRGRRLGLAARPQRQPGRHALPLGPRQRRGPAELRRQRQRLLPLGGLGLAHRAQRQQLRAPAPLGPRLRRAAGGAGRPLGPRALRGCRLGCPEGPQRRR